MFFASQSTLRRFLETLWEKCSDGRLIENFMEEEASTRSGMTSLPGWRLESCFYDLLHTLYLGVALDLIGTCLMLMTDPCARGLRDVRLLQLWRSCRAWAKQRKLINTVERFSLKQLGATGKGFPILKVHKGANVLPTLAWLADAARGTTPPRVQALTFAINQIVEILQRAPICLKPRGGQETPKPIGSNRNMKSILLGFP
jgi:hypothetical protein